MVDTAQVAKDIETITGISFDVFGDALGNTTPINGVSFSLMTDLCRRIEGFRVAIEDGPLGTTRLEAPLNLITDDIAAEIATTAAMAPDRIQRLEEALPVLQEKTGLPFAFDESHRVLVVADPRAMAPELYETASGKMTGSYTEALDASTSGVEAIASPPHEHQASLLRHLAHKGAIQYGYVADAAGDVNTIAVGEVDLDILRNTAMPEVNPADGTVDVAGFKVKAPGSRPGRETGSIGK